MQNAERALAMMETLRGLGVRLSIDDFGSGYSSLAALKTFPFDRLKMDRSLVEALPGDKTAVAIASAVISLAQTLKLSVLAEGVETDAQMDFLRQAHCEEAQGFRFSKPVSRRRSRHCCGRVVSDTYFISLPIASISFVHMPAA